MIFQSLDYLIFFVAVFSAYWLLPLRGQNALLLVAGHFFYGYVHPWYCILLGATTLVDYIFTRLMEARPSRKRLWLGCILVSNFAVLATFKYFGFFTENLLAILRAAGWDVASPVFHMLLPAGVSFYTFQSCAYAVDVYRGHTNARRNLLDYAVYVAFFPQLVAGPIERPAHLLTQFGKPRRFRVGLAQDALFLILWGLMKKRVIADTAAVYANKAFSLSDSSFPIIWAGVLCFCVQIYADFSAYTDIARGSARPLGFELRQNFNHPWLAQSPGDFWRRWHMSLSEWFRDYVFIPLGGSRGSEGRIACHLMLTFLLSGLWHGASWNFILWGAWWGALLVLWRVLDRCLPGFTKAPGPARSLL
ncbi:MAG: MBOAT family O-acyltransferase, partial [Roseimicrobium sp.]